MSSNKNFFLTILVVEDDTNLALVVKRKLESMGYNVTTMSSGKDGYEAAISNKYALMMVDIGLPEMNGLKLIQRVRENDIKTPAIIITNQLNSDNEVSAFRSGANLFHPKPLDFNLLEAQVKSLMTSLAINSGIELGDMRIDPNRRQVIKDGKDVELSLKEFELLRLLISVKGNVLTRQDIISGTFGRINDVTEGSVDTLVSRARKKLGIYQGKDVIQTVHGSGFRINPSYFQT